MQRLGKIILVCGLFSPILPASSVLTCAFDSVSTLAGAGCYTSPFATTNFQVSEIVDLQTAYGLADHFNTRNPWNYTTPDGLGISVSAPGLLSRYDNFASYYDPRSGTFRAYDTAGSPYEYYNIYQGMFDAQPDAGAGSPGDHLLGSDSGANAFEIDFNRNISGIMFRISTPTSGDVNAVISAYAVEHPTAFDTPIMTYRIDATNAAGICASLAAGAGTPTPCNLAPWLGIVGGNGQIRSVIISTNDTSTYIGDFFIEEAPEPSTFALFAGGFASLAFLRRRAPRS